MPSASRSLLLILCGASFLESLDISMMSVALPSIDADLGLTTGSLQWILGAYALGYGGFLLLGGRAADLLGRRRVFVAALAVFAIVSALGAAAQAGAPLIAARFLTGVCAGFAAPAGLSLVTTTFAEGPERTRALTVYTATAASGFTFGLVAGGLLTGLTWRLTFAAPAVAAALLCVGAARIVPRDAPSAGGRRVDALGALLVTGGMLALVAGITAVPAAGWAAAATVVPLAAAIALLAAFVAVERRRAVPLLPLGILRSRALVRANVVMATIGAFVAFQLVATLYLQDVAGLSPLDAALAFLPAGVLIAVGAPRVAPVVQRLGPRVTLAIGMLGFALGFANFLRTDAELDYVAVMLPTLLCLGVGFTLGYPSANVVATGGVRDAEQGLASGLVNTSFQLGAAVTLAVATAVVAGHDGDRLGALHAGLLAVVACALVGLLVAATGLGRIAADR